jgi:hypothetical protein
VRRFLTLKWPDFSFHTASNCFPLVSQDTDDNASGAAGGPDEENPTPGGTMRPLGGSDSDLSKLNAAASGGADGNDQLLQEQQKYRSQFRANMRAKYLKKG